MSNKPKPDPAATQIQLALQHLSHALTIGLLIQEPHDAAQPCPDCIQNDARAFTINGALAEGADRLRSALRILAERRT